MKNLFSALAVALLFARQAVAQTVSEIVTDYNGYWRSGTTARSATKPESSHNLLAFTFNGVRYSTGANNAVLTANGLSFTAGDYRALGVNNIGSAGSATRLALGASWDGVANGASNPLPSRALAPYLTDGIQGLDIGTGVANLPSGTLVFGVNNLQNFAIGDGIPDIIVTQVADPSGGTDSYQFVNGSNGTVGNTVSISFNGLDTLAVWTGDFYNAQANPVTLAAHETRADKPIRLWAADFSAFGITSANASSVTGFRINLNGNSDVAFIAYNHAVVSILPVTLNFFGAAPQGDGAELRWQTATDGDLAYTEVQGGPATNDLRTIGTVPGRPGAATQDFYFHHSLPKGGTHYYRLKLVSANGTFKYSSTVRVSLGVAQSGWELAPNPTTGLLRVTHPAGAEGRLKVVNAAGVPVLQKQVIGGTGLTELNTEGLPPGIYRLVVPGNPVGLAFVRL